MGTFANTFSRSLGSQGSKLNPPYRSDAAFLFGKTLINKSGLYYLKNDLLNNQDALLRDFPCLNSNGVKGFLHGDSTTVYDSDYQLQSGCSTLFEFDFILDSAPAALRTIYFGGGEDGGTGGIRITLETNKTIRIGISNKITWNNLVSTAVCAIGYNKILVGVDLTALTAYTTINGVTKNFSITLTGGDYMRNYTNLFVNPYSPTVFFESHFIRFAFTKNGTKLHEYFFNDGINFKYTHYIIPDLVGSKDLYVSATVNPFTLSQNSDFKLLTEGYNVYVKKDWPERLFVCPKMADAVNDTEILTALPGQTFTLLETMPALSYLHGICNYINFNPTSSNDAKYDVFDITNRIYWKVAVESDPLYNAANKWSIPTSWLNSTKLALYANTNHFHSWVNNYNFVDVEEKIQRTVEYIVAYTNEHIISQVLDKNVNKSYSHLYYSRKNKGKTGYLKAAFGLKRLVKDGDNIYYSSDNGQTWGSAVNIKNVYSGIIPEDKFFFTQNGSILLLTHTQHAYRSSDNGQTWTECSYKNSDGSAFVFHTPINPALPGSYFHTMNGFYNNISDNLILIGNYGNSGYGASPIILWYSIDDGATFKVAYTFGQNPANRDDGVSVSGGTTGNLLGDSNNTIICRHIHGVNRNQFDGSYWFVTGDGILNGVSRDNIMRSVYDSVNDTWQTSSVLTLPHPNNERFRIINIMFKDANTAIVGIDGIESGFNTMCSVPINSFNDLNAWVKMDNYPLPNVSVYGITTWDDGRILVYPNSSSPYCLIYSLDWGNTWVTVATYDSIFPAINNSWEWLNIIGDFIFSGSDGTYKGGMLRLIK